MRIVNQQRLVVRPGRIHGLERAVAAEPEPLAAVGAEPHWLAMLEPDQPVVPGPGIRDRRERVVVVDRAVLVDLDERGAAMIGGRPQHPGEGLAVRGDGPGHQARPRAAAPRARDTGLKGVSSEPNGVDLVTFPCSEVGEYWPLVSP